MGDHARAPGAGRADRRAHPALCTPPAPRSATTTSTSTAAGYPDGLARFPIPIEARIVAVADTFSAMTQQRPYASARSAEDALAELRRCAGTQFDPAIVAALEVVLAAEDADALPRAA